MTFRVLDPTPEKAPPAGQLAPRLDTLQGKTIGFISNGKEGNQGLLRPSRPAAARGVRRGQGG